MRISKLAALSMVMILAAGAAACGQSTVQSETVQPLVQSEAAAAPQQEGAEQPEFYAAISPDVNPYTGLAKTENYPQGTRGVAVMINNVQAALPQSGLNAADLVYEMETESGITRLMAVYRDYTAMPTVGPIRSARDQHVQLMLPLNALYAHIGTSTYAASMLDTYHFTDVRSLDGKYRNYYWIDAERRATRAQEHCVYTNGENFAEAVERYGLDTALGEEPAPVFNWVPLQEPRRELTGGAARSVYVRFSSYAYSEFVYNEAAGTYTKYEFGGPQQDMAEGGSPYTADNLFILFTEMEKYPDGVLTHVSMENGAGLYFCGGRYEVVRWKKGRPEQPLRILDSEGHETDIRVNPGRSYVAMVDSAQIENMHIDRKTLQELGL